MADRSSRGGPDRQHPRVTVDAFVRIMGGEREYVFRTRDLSEGGLFLYTRVGHLYPFFVGAALSIELYDYDQAVEFRAVVVRIVEGGSPEAERFPSGFGVRIVEIDEQNRLRLDELIKRAQKEPLY
ncbi:MAG TPA: PilZ domain-containing protein [Polyangia bacterium]|nr:PilZ domain-containing protein [Polyangia bacterium]